MTRATRAPRARSLTRANRSVRAFYEATAASESRRLALGFYRRLERDMTVRTIDRHFAAGARILDVGGGPGAYLGPLAERGFDPWLCDLAAANVARARDRARALGLSDVRARVRRADATDLGAYPRGQFDGALVAGPFYHLTEPAAQRRALAELVRVVAPGGPIVLAILPRLHPLRYLLREASRASWSVLGAVDWDRVLASGRWRNPTRDPVFFTDAHLWRVDELHAFLRARGCRVVDTLAVESFAAFADVTLERWVKREAAYARLLELVDRTSRAPELIGSAEHVLVVARTPRRRR